MSVKILTVDDSKTIRLIVARALKPYNCVVLEAANGMAGLSVAAHEKPDVILLDYTMPLMDGFEVLARLRSDPELKATPVIMLTAEAGRDTVMKIAKLGVRDYLIKPFKEELLVERVGRVVPLGAKSDEALRPKRYDDPINILVVDDKPAIVEHIRTGLAGTAWKVISADQPGQALDICLEQPIDVVFVSLSLPKDGAYMLFQNLRGRSNSTTIPIFALSVKTAVEEQTRAQQTGFTGIVTKPIDPEEFKAKVCRALRLETSYKYFEQRQSVLLLKLPKELHPAVVNDVSVNLDDQLSRLVDAGGDKLILDLSEVERATLPIIELGLAAIKACGKLSLKNAIIASASTKTECNVYAETQNWLFAESFEKAVALLK